MEFDNFKSVIFNKITDIYNSNSVFYKKLYIYDEIKEKLKHNLNIMPKKEKLKGVVKAWSFNPKLKPDQSVILQTSENYPQWKEDYNKFINKKNRSGYLYYIETKNNKLGKLYETVIVVFGKKHKSKEFYKILKSVDISESLKTDIANEITAKKINL